MRTVNKYNYDTKKYEVFNIPESTPLWTEDMNEIIMCAECHREIKFGDSYTSMTIHSGAGLGFPVCESCYYQEMKDYQEMKERKRAHELKEQRGY